MSRVLRIAEVCRELGRSPDCIRDWVHRGILPATRSPSGQLQFDPRDVQAIKRGELAPAVGAPAHRQPDPMDPAPLDPTSPEAPPRQPRRPPWEEMAPWDQQVEQAKASVDVERLNTELESVRDERDRVHQAAARMRSEGAAEAAERGRLTRLKQQARLQSWVPRDIEARVTAEIERFVTSEQVPAWLSSLEQSNLVLAHVRGIVRAWSDEQTSKAIAQIKEAFEKPRQLREESRKREEEKRKEAELKPTPDSRALDRARRRQEREGRLGL